MPPTIVNLFPIPPAPALPGLATGGTGTTGSAPVPSDTPTTPSGSTPPPITPPIGGVPTVTTFPTQPDPGQQVIMGGVLYQWVGSTQYAGIVGFWEPVVSPAPALQDTHANRLANYPAANYAEGTTFFETDRTVVYIIQSGAWVFWSGAMAGQLADLPNDLGGGDAGFHFQCLDFKHLYKWAGSTWNFDPNDPGSGFLTVAGPGFFIADGLYGLCDGSTYTVAQGDGTTTSVTPAVAANTYIRR